MDTLLGKARLVLESFDAESDLLSLTEIARRSGVAKTTVYRIANELVLLGFLERAGHMYRLGLRLFELGQLAPRQRILRELSATHVQHLHAITCATVYLAIRDGSDVLYIEKISGHYAAGSDSRVAGRLPLHVTAVGKAILAYSPPELVDSVLADTMVAFTSYTVNSPDELRRQLEQVRAQSIAVEIEEVRLGTASIAAPIFGGHGIVVAAIGVSIPRYRMSIECIEGPLKAAAAEISRECQISQRSA